MGERLAKKMQRLKELERILLKAHPHGLHNAELARQIGINRSEIPEYLQDLAEDKIQVYDTYDGKHAIDPATHKVRLHLTLDESLAVLLAVRLLTTRTDKRNPHAAGALLELASAFDERAPFIAQHIRRSAEAVAGAHRRDAPLFINWLKGLTRAWADRQQVKLVYESEEGHPVIHTFSTYFIEPYALGNTLYVIGRSNLSSKLLTLKVERIREVEVLESKYEIPPDFDPTEILRDAWGIWRTEKPVQTVTLRFASSVAYRVRETQWHYAEQVTPQANGDLIWQAAIAEPREMLPWIRGWGADCEVLEPKWLRTELVREAQVLAEVYDLTNAAMAKIEYYGHSLRDKDKSEWQLLKEHLLNTANLAEKFGQDAGVSGLARTAALLHDIGKYSKAFQARLDGNGHKVDHATAGAKEVRNLFNKGQLEKSLATILSYCIAGHHTGLPDYGDSSDVDGTGTLLARVEKKKLEDFSAYKGEIDPASLILQPRKLKTANEAFSVAFMTRMIFSALVDADFQDTETFMQQGAKPRGGHASLEELCKTFNAAIKKFDNPQGEINKKRTETLKACIEKASLEQGFFTLTIPTGGGKTLASMAFALNHAIKHGLKRVVYVIPFTSIIEQNAAVFKDYLGDVNILEHHSNFDWKKGDKKDSEEADDETRDALDKLKLASENWDIPIVVTTNVQFFESLFANKSSRCRKLHNLAKSVIIFDEAQTLPREYLDPCMLAVKELVVNYGASAVFCTATQPALNKRLKNVTFTELASDPQALFDFYKRVQVTNIGTTPDAMLIDKIKSHTQVLCIVNTRKHAKGLFDQLEGKGNFHLSTLMCPAHRKEVLATIRALLADQSKPTCRVISTQVMEAGIDVDFSVGFRALAGLDSIIQAAGRVNREMKRGQGDMFVFDPETPFIKRTPTFVEQGARVAEGILRDFEKQPDSIKAIEEYFLRLNALHNEKTAYDVKRILSYFDNDIEFEFKKAAEEFRLIENNTVPVIIPYNQEANKLIEKARYSPYPFSVARQLQMYTVNIYEYEFEKLRSKGVIETCNETYEVLTTLDFYNEQTGLILPADAGGDAIFIDV